MSFRARSLQTVLIFGSLLCIVGLCWSTLALAAQPDPSLPGNHLVIKEVEVVVDEATPQTTFNIKGEYFDFVNLSDLVVTLGDYNNPLSVDFGVTTSTYIVATLDSAILPGDYLLSVSTGPGQSKHDEYDLTIGAVGPQGEQGATRRNGADGSAGTNGDYLGNKGLKENKDLQGKTGSGGGSGTLVVTERTMGWVLFW